MSGYFKSILEWIFSWLGNYGWSVVLFTLAVRMILLPLDIRSKKSMRAMSKVQPKVQALQKKYANDRDKLNVKLNELYKKEHVSPMAGCLPMLISLPILWWMFAGMRQLANEHTINMLLQMKTALENGETPEVVAEAVRGSMQSWLWIKNVFQPDTITTILPKIGDSLNTITAVANSSILTADNLEAVRQFLTTDAYASVANLFGASQFTQIPLSLLIINPSITLPASISALVQYSNGYFILPIAAALSQFFMTKITAMQQGPKKSGEEMSEEERAAADASNAMNNGFMKWFFPLFSLYICAGYNAAFSIYWMAANVIQIVQQVAVNWYFDRKEAKENIIEIDESSVK